MLFLPRTCLSWLPDPHSILHDTHGLAGLFFHAAIALGEDVVHFMGARFQLGAAC